MKLNLDYIKDFVNINIAETQLKVNKIHDKIHSVNKPSEFLGWLNLPNEIDEELLLRIEEVGKNIRNNSKVLVVVGIGGSYAGSKAGIEFLEQPFKKNDLEVIYAGHNISGRYLDDLVNYLKDKDFSVNVISKSGTTTEPAIAFRILKKYCNVYFIWYFFNRVLVSVRYKIKGE